MKIKVLMLLFFVIGGIGVCSGGRLRENFYGRKCRSAEEIAKNITWGQVASNPALPAKLLRMHFHDCFVRGCDGSVLVNSTKNNTAEKDAPPNLTLAGFDVIDLIKEKLEQTCPGIVSCADILALAARDAVAFQFKESKWDVLTGRRDGIISLESEALANIPSPAFNFSTLVQRFAGKGLNRKDLVVLSGAHTIGVGHCFTFSNRLYNFTGKGDQDPSLNSTYAAFLKTKCTNPPDATTTVEMVPKSTLSFDNDYYVNLKQHKGLFQSDAALLTNTNSIDVVNQLLESREFFEEFAISIKKMGAIGVLTGNAGQIRKICSAVNS